MILSEQKIFDAKHYLRKNGYKINEKLDYDSNGKLVSVRNIPKGKVPNEVYLDFLKNVVKNRINKIKEVRDALKNNDIEFKERYNVTFRKFCEGKANYRMKIEYNGNWLNANTLIRLAEKYDKNLLDQVYNITFKINAKNSIDSIRDDTIEFYKNELVYGIVDRREWTWPQIQTPAITKLNKARVEGNGKISLDIAIPALKDFMNLDDILNNDQLNAYEAKVKNEREADEENARWYQNGQGTNKRFK